MIHSQQLFCLSFAFLGNLTQNITIFLVKLYFFLQIFRCSINADIAYAIFKAKIMIHGILFSNQGAPAQHAFKG